ncbi:MAG: hypothetical protein HY925_10000 [Elusimicrobia bacterium]|nr:hypothetical protein [Elusimicrobiota bacterium]
MTKKVPDSIQLNYARESVRLMLWFMKRKTKEGVPFRTALTDYADIYRKTSFFDLTNPDENKRRRPQWDELVARLEAVFPHLEGELSVLALLDPFLKERVVRGLPLVDYQAHADFGCFYYAPMNEVIDLHFTNTLLPASPFKDTAALVRDLASLVADVRAKHPSATHIKCGSWLNAFPPFRALFPGGWKDSGEPKSYNSLGWWGQFARHDGDFHAKNAEKFRSTGEFPYRCTFHKCSLAELEAFLKAGARA